ncbi:helix-turn-helix domain-containing protein [Spirosoma sp. HMF4905]|uniref:Helix-turn-helix domain-containing protein n=1 Tax=Spirosoma arboris TaxID=2682092 RepID=A0A7K1SLJ1_9BACT|nr:helix-turn-helix domain-containing protein [Spirosoma arboris]MVM34446.1 helix-turn-helix domain-containing protein [Spirosoma arboris]
MPHKNTSTRLLKRKEAADYLGVTLGTLAVWDCTKRRQLNPVKIGKLVHYRLSDLDQFLDQRLSD